MGYTKIGCFMRIQDRQPVLASKLMNSLRLALTVGFFSLISFAHAGTGPELKSGPAPTEDENKNSTELFEYETVYTGKSDFKEYGGAFGEGDSLYNLINYAHRFHVTGNWYFRAGVEYERFDFGGTPHRLPDQLQNIPAPPAHQYNLKDPARA